MKDLKTLSSSPPHVRAKQSSGGIMQALILALLPTTGFGIYYFGLDALFIILVTVGTAVMTEYISGLILKRPVTVGDCSAIVSGLLLALCLPPDVPIWLAMLGAVFAILVVKMLFGGLGQNIMNPAMAARSFLLISFAPLMTAYRISAHEGREAIIMSAVDGESGALTDLMFGYTGGMIGETTIIAIIIGAVLLLLLGVIDLRIPAAYIISFVLFLMLFSGNMEPLFLLSHVVSGGLLLGAFFMATDYVTRPLTGGGQFIYGILLGFLTALFRYFGSGGGAGLALGGIEAVAFAIIIANLLVPLIDRFFSGKRRAYAVKGQR